MASWHLLTGEYPPQPGGISDYTAALAGGLSASGADVHVWCPPTGGVTPAVTPGVTVHRVHGLTGLRHLGELSRRLDSHALPRTILVQYAPQAFGLWGMNVFLPFWLLRRAQQGDDVRVMFHEPYVEFTLASLRRNVLALANRVMAATLLRASRITYVSTAAWVPFLQPLVPRRAVLHPLPVACALPVTGDADGARSVRGHFASGAFVIGHFGTYGALLAPTLAATLTTLLRDEPAVAILLLGRGSEAFRTRLLTETPDFTARIVATDALPSADVSRHVRACDMLVQPYPDGATTRRTSLMCALANGTPVVTTHGRLTEPVWEEARIPMAAADDAPAIAALVRTLMHDDVARDDAGRRGAALYEQRFAIARTVDVLLRGTP